MVFGEYCMGNLMIFLSGVNLIGVGIFFRGRDSILIVVLYRENWDDFFIY